MSEYQVFTNKDIFQHIFFQYMKHNVKFIGESILRVSEVCKGFLITSDIWKFFFKHCGYKLPKFVIKDNKTWCFLMLRENNIIKWVNKCVECIDFVGRPWGNMDEHLYFERAKKYFMSGDTCDALYFDLRYFDIENILHLIQDEKREELWNSWIQIFNDRTMHEGGEDLAVSHFDVMIMLEIDEISGEEQYMFAFGQKYKFYVYFNKENIRKLIEIFIRNGLHPCGDCNDKLLF